MNEQKFFRCRHCGNLVALLHDAQTPMLCCGEPMQALVPNTVEAATEKHIPVVSTRDRLIHAAVGSVAHPMTEEHHIEFLYLQTQKGGQLKRLSAGAVAEAMFVALDDTPCAVYAYCNLHGLWMAEVSTGDCKESETGCAEDCTEGCAEGCAEGCKHE